MCVALATVGPVGGVSLCYECLSAKYCQLFYPWDWAARNLLINTPDVLQRPNDKNSEIFLLYGLAFVVCHLWLWTIGFNLCRATYGCGRFVVTRYLRLLRFGSWLSASMGSEVSSGLSSFRCVSSPFPLLHFPVCFTWRMPSSAVFGASLQL